MTGPNRRHVLVVAAALLSALAAAPRHAGAGETPADFIRGVGEQGFAVMRSPATLREKSAYFRRLLRQDFDLTRICRFVLGPYWTLASAGQRQEFGGLFEDHLLRFYGQRLARSGGESLQVTGSRTDAAGVTVTSQIVRRQGMPVAVDWQLTVADGVYKISDVAIDGVSMVLAERAEFSAVIARDGGQVEGLLTALRQEGPAFGASTPPPFPPSAAGG